MLLKRTWPSTCDIFDEASVLVWCIISKKIISLVSTSISVVYSHSHHCHLSDDWPNPSKNHLQIPLPSSNPQHLPHWSLILSFQIMSIAYIHMAAHTRTRTHLRRKVPLKEIKVQIWISTNESQQLPSEVYLGNPRYSRFVDDLSCIGDIFVGEARCKGYIRY